MNKVYRIIWNSAQQCFTVANEFAKGKSKSSSANNSASIFKALSLNKIAASLLLVSGVSPAFADNGLGAIGSSATFDGQDVTTTSDFVNDSDRTMYGLLAMNDGGVMNYSNGNVQTSGNSAYGIVAYQGGKLTATGASVTTQGNSSSAAYSTSPNSSMTLKQSQLTTFGTDSHGVYAASSGVADLENVDIVTHGKASYGAYAASIASSLTFSGGSITTTGANSYGLVAGRSAVINADNLVINASSYGIYANAATINAKTMTVNVNTANNVGVYSNANGGILNLDDSTINVNADSATGITSAASGKFTGTNIAINLSGTHQSGVLALASGANANSLNQVSITGDNGGKALRLENSGIITATGSHIALNNLDGTATDNSGAVFDGLITAANTLNFTDSDMTLTGSNAIGLRTLGGVNTANLTNSSMVADNGVAIQADAARSLMVNADNSIISGKTLLQSGFGALGNVINNVQLNATNHSVLTGDVNIDPTQTTTSQIALDSASVWSGASEGLQNLSLNGASQWNMTGDSSLGGLTVNNSTLNFTHDGDNTFKTLTINGNYAANNATLVMSGNLGGDASNTDKLHITGDSSGNTDVTVNNIGGTGGQTLNGLQLIQVDGASDGEFNQKGRIVAGAYDYQLIRGQGAQDKNWVLMSNIKLIDPPVIPPVVPPVEPPVDPVTPPVDPVTPPVDPVTPPVDPITPPVDPITPPPSAVDMVVRPEAGSYATNMAASNTLFGTSLQQRMQGTEYIDPITGEKKSTSLWMINEGGHNRSTDSSGQLKTQANRYVIQLGGDVLQGSSNSQNRFHLGVMGGYANQHSTTHSNVTGYQSTGTTDGYSAGVYGTWFENDATKTGAYVDSSLRYSGFNNSVSSDSIGNQSYRSKGFTASIESGYTWQVSELSERSALYLQPKAQLTWMNVKADSFNENNGTRVSGQGDGNVQSRLGVRAYVKGHSDIDNGKTHNVEPYVEANWVHNTENFGSALDGVNISQRGAENLAEVKVGVDAKVNHRVNLWGSVGQQFGTQSYSDTAATIGVKVNF